MVEENQEEKKESNPIISLVITLDLRNGRIGVTGPITDKLLSYGLLEAAKDVVRKQVDTPSPIVKPNGHGIIDFMRGGKR